MKQTTLVEVGLSKQVKRTTGDRLRITIWEVTDEKRNQMEAEYSEPLMAS